MRMLSIAGFMVAAVTGTGLTLWDVRGRQDVRPVTNPTLDVARIVYPANALPVLTTADGQRRPIRSMLNVRDRMKYGDYIWNEAGVPAGPAWVKIDLDAQTLSLFRAGHEIGTAVILYGTDDKPTPTGVFPILERAEHHRSSLYDAEMPFMLRLTPDGVAIHASNVRHGSATHGCIGVPKDFARRMFAQVRRGSIVAIERPGAATAPATS